MALIEYWIQLENHAWDTAPNNIDRMSGENIQQLLGQAPVVKTLTSPMTGVTRNVNMFLPVDDALILRRYRPPQLRDQSDAWTVPDDRKVNPWDLNEKDPTDTGTMGTIPGPVIECNVGDTVRVHFRNRDTRANKNTHERAHSLHPHGFVFENRFDGAYPLSPPDATQPVGAEGPLWALVGVPDNKKGDRVPGPDPAIAGVPNGGTFIYEWNTFGWPTTAGVWHYHDHSICDVDNVLLGAIGIIAIHNPNDPDDVIGQDLPGGSVNGHPTQLRCFPFPFDVAVLPHDLNRFQVAHPPGPIPPPLPRPPQGGGDGGGGPHLRAGDAASAEKNPEAGATDEQEPRPAFQIQRGDLIFELSDDLKLIRALCIRHFRTPPQNALYLQLYHEMPGVSMLINGRKFIGNAPTLVAGPSTKMRFGVVGMNDMMFHTFHLHGHRWVIPGPRGDSPGGGGGANAVQNSPLVQAASQFEDTKIFGPANSFVFTIRQGAPSFMGAPFGRALGEWHMHCHVLGHMHSTLGGGMMGSLLVIQGGESAFGPHFGLPLGEPCHGAVQPPEPGLTANVRSTAGCQWRDDTFGTPETTIKVNGTVTWFDNGCSPHTVVSQNLPGFTNWPTPLNNLAVPAAGTAPQPFPQVGDFAYICGVHGGDPALKSGMYGIIHVVP